MLDALVPIDSAMPGALVPIEAEKASARRYASLGKAPSTVAGYRRDFAAFARWCTARGLASMPATNDTVILHVTALADGGLSVSSIGRRWPPSPTPAPSTGAPSAAPSADRAARAPSPALPGWCRLTVRRPVFSLRGHLLDQFGRPCAGAREPGLRAA